MEAQPQERLTPPSFERRPERYNFPEKLNEAFMSWVKEEFCRKGTILQVPSPTGGLAWITTGVSKDFPQRIILQSPSTGRDGAVYGPQIAEYDIETGERIGGVHVEETHQDITKILES